MLDSGTNDFALLNGAAQNVTGTGPATTWSHSLQSTSSLPIRSIDHTSKEVRGYPISLSAGDINTAAALRAQYAIETPKTTRRRHKKATTQIIDEDTNQPIVDQTAHLALHSKKSERLQRKQQKRTERLAHQQSLTTSLLSLPSELLTDISTHLLPQDIVSLHLTCQHLHHFLVTHEPSIARTIIHRRYWTLYRCFPVPIPITSVPSDVRPALLSDKRQEMLSIHRKPYQHIQMIDPTTICTCLTCIFAWNNLCLVLDLHHWQPHLQNREPIPVISRGSNPPWNVELLCRNAEVVRTAMARPLVHAHILHRHLTTITDTIQRNSQWRRKVAAPGKGIVPVNVNGNGNSGVAASASSAAAAFPSASKPKLYHLTDSDALAQTDQFLERSGPPSYDFPYMRDNYYSLEAYVPNRKWSSESGRWHYYGLPPVQHERDLEWVRSQGTRGK